MRGALAILALGLRALPCSATAVSYRLEARAAANPIRKVVSMLQNMQKKITEEGVKEQDLYDKFMCYCTTSGGALSESIGTAKAKIEAVSAEIKETGEKSAQIRADLKEHTGDRDEAEDAVARAQALREKEAGAFAKLKSDHEMNIAAIAKAVVALEKGAGGAFLQTPSARLVRDWVMEKADLPDESRQELLVFLSGTQSESYAPQSGEITGILKQMRDEMEKTLSDATVEEQERSKSHAELMAAKKKQLASLQAQIEDKMARQGNDGVQLAELKNDLEDTREALAADEKFQEQIKKGCATKEQEWEVVKKTRAEELLALAETIKVLNDDDALSLFRTTLPRAGASLVQVEVSSARMRARALQMIRQASKLARRPELDLLVLALNGKAAGFEKIFQMIDKLVATLRQEQADDDAKKSYCEDQLDQTDDKRKELELSMKDSQTAIDEMSLEIQTLVKDIASLAAGVKTLDKAVAEASEQRKNENADFKSLMASDGTAKEVLGWAKNRLNKFYNPKLYKPPAKRELSEEDRITVNMGGTVAPTTPGGIAGTGIGALFVQISAHAQSSREAPPPPPETFGAYTKKGEMGNGVIEMIDLLVRDLDKEMQEASVSEKDAQADYEAMMADASAKRAADSKSITEKNAIKANSEQELDAEKEKKTDTGKVHMATSKQIAVLHGECDWLLQYHAARKEARGSEIESLGQAKAVLSGADYALVQVAAPVSRVNFLARRMH